MLPKNTKIFLAGHNGMVGSSIYKELVNQGYNNIVIASKKKLNLLDQKKVEIFLKKVKPKITIIAAAKVGGILANNNFKADFIYENIMIQSNLIHSSYLAGVNNLIFLGSSCIYPKNAPQPMKEKYLLTGKLEGTNDAYSVAKISGIKMCESYSAQYKVNYKALMPANMFGANDNYDLKSSHFFPALIIKALAAKKNKKNELTLWGSGKPKRELMYVDDLADACIYFLNKKTKDSLINIGTGHDKSILEYAKFILKKINYKCTIILDKSKPDGTKRKIIDNSIALSYGWKPKINLDDGFELTLKSYFSKSNK